MAATMKDIARRTGLGLATISSYFNGGNVREKNRIKIEEAIQELHYEVNEVARGLKTNATKTIGELRRDPVKAQQYEKLVWEAASVGQAKGVALTDEHINEVIHKFRYVHADNATSSLHSIFCGFPVSRQFHIQAFVCRKFGSKCLKYSIISILLFFYFLRYIFIGHVGSYRISTSCIIIDLPDGFTANAHVPAPLYHEIQR